MDDPQYQNYKPNSNEKNLLEDARLDKIDPAVIDWYKEFIINPECVGLLTLETQGRWELGNMPEETYTAGVHFYDSANQRQSTHIFASYYPSGPRKDEIHTTIIISSCYLPISQKNFFILQELYKKRNHNLSSFRSAFSSLGAYND